MLLPKEYIVSSWEILLAAIEERNMAAARASVGVGRAASAAAGAQ
jgi:hypothetical protein